MKKALLILLALLLADIVVCVCGTLLIKEGSIESVPFLIIPLVVLVPFHWLAITALKEEVNNRKK